MSKHLHSQHHYNICQRDSNGILWSIARNYTEDQASDYVKDMPESLRKGLAVIMVETNTSDVSFEFLEND